MYMYRVSVCCCRKNAGRFLSTSVSCSSLPSPCSDCRPTPPSAFNCPGNPLWNNPRHPCRINTAICYLTVGNNSFFEFTIPKSQEQIVRRPKYFTTKWQTIYKQGHTQGGDIGMDPPPELFGPVFKFSTS